MLLLAVDTATPLVAAAVHDGTRVVAAATAVAGRRHGELLAPLVVDVLARAGAEPADLTAVVAGLGPGPYTGLRVGVVTAAATALALGVPAYGVCTLDALAEGTCTVVSDARRGELYWASYDDGVRVAGPGVDRPADVPRHGRLVGPGVAAHPLPGARERALEPGRLAELALERASGGAPSEALRPLYLRRPDAAEPRPPKVVLPA